MAQQGYDLLTTIQITLKDQLVTMVGGLRQDPTVNSEWLLL